MIYVFTVIIEVTVQLTYKTTVYNFSACITSDAIVRLAFGVQTFLPS